MCNYDNLPHRAVCENWGNFYTDRKRDDEDVKEDECFITLEADELIKDDSTTIP